MRVMYTTAIVGIHLGNTCNKSMERKEYVWKATHEQANKICVGDILFVQTKKGRQKIIVTNKKKLRDIPFPEEKITPIDNNFYLLTLSEVFDALNYYVKGSAFQ